MTLGLKGNNDLDNKEIMTGIIRKKFMNWDSTPKFKALIVLYMVHSLNLLLEDEPPLCPLKSHSLKQFKDYIPFFVLEPLLSDHPKFAMKHIEHHGLG